MLKLEKHLENRLELINALKEDIIGPISNNENMLPLSTIGDIKLATKEDLYKRYYQKESKQEIIQRNNPSAHYVSGMLYPYTKPSNSMSESSVGDELNLTQDEDENGQPNISEEALKKLSKSKARLEKFSEADEDDDLVPQKNEYLPSSLGLSYYINLSEQGSITFFVRGGRYLPQSIFTHDNSQKQRWWFRNEVEAKVTVTCDELNTHNRRPFNKPVVNDKINDMKLEIQILSRKLNDGYYLITASLTNRTEITSKTYDEMDKYALFQSEMEIELSKGMFLKYPRVQTGLEDDEEKSNQLLYKNAAIYGLGHNCSCDWKDENVGVKRIKSTFLPTYETQSMTPDIKDENGHDFSVSMLELSGKSGSRAEKSAIHKVVDSYENWINQKESSIIELDDYYQPIAKSHMTKCRISLQRMRRGLKLLENPKVLKAFQLANQAMILQQVNGTEVRKGHLKEGSLVYDKPKETLTVNNISNLKNSGKGNWRAFQIAFILMALESVISGDSPDREVVDLIWFPTGGGKTEAYLGLSAFSMFYRRLMNPNDIGTDIIMRYTLRLLTADQFQRSSRLICAMEHIRRKEGIGLLGSVPYTIGIWLGGDTTPNTNDKALKQLTALNHGGKTEDFIVRFCPWCGATLGKYDEHNQKKRRGGTKSLYHGYKKVHKRMVIHCPDNTCEFHDDLPIYIVDETIYEVKPTFLLGTIDKFAMLAWRPQARTLFGLNENGEREVSPPNLIIQDELHLISGPLGTVSGLYEVVIEELCTDNRFNRTKKPKIVCATATIRRFEEQIRNLYGRTGSQLFPSPGLDFDDSFFAQTAKDEQGKNRPGRMYVGVYSPTVQLMTLQVKTFATFLQSVKILPKEEQDPFWTLLSFYNSIRELGGGMTLTQTDIPNYFNQVRFKKAITDKEQYRWINHAVELTSRLKSGEVAGAIGQLKKDISEWDAIDICLASNIIEVGVDIDRLSLMTIVGQPKTTAQYIQVSGRVGRKWWERPGLIVSLFASGRSRDKSHFEHFREYHEQLYAQVEPTSVTPFSDPSIKKVLPAIITIFLRQMHDAQIAKSPETISEYQFELEAFKHRLLKRVELIDPLQKDVVQAEFDRFVRRLNSNFLIWEKKDDDMNIGVMYLAGSYVSDEQKRLGTPVLMSMRSVDAQCVGTVSSLFMEIEDQGDDF